MIDELRKIAEEIVLPYDMASQYRSQGIYNRLTTWIDRWGPFVEAGEIIAERREKMAIRLRRVTDEMSERMGEDNNVTMVVYAPRWRATLNVVMAALEQREERPSSESCPHCGGPVELGKFEALP